MTQQPKHDETAGEARTVLSAEEIDNRRFLAPFGTRSEVVLELCDSHEALRLQVTRLQEERDTARLHDKVHYNQLCLAVPQLVEQRERAEAAEALVLQQQEEIARLTRINEIERRNYERLALCPDHRDKASGRCIVCQAETRSKEPQP